MTTQPVNLSPAMQQLQFSLGVPNATSIKVHQASMNIFQRIWHALTSALNSLFGIGVQEKREALNLAHFLKNQGYMTQADFFSFKEAYAIDKETAKTFLKDYLKSCLDTHKIDRRIYFQLFVKVHEGDLVGVLKMVQGLASIQHLHKFSKELEQVVSAKEHNQLLDMLKSTYDQGRFAEKDLECVANLKARVEILAWINSRQSSPSRDRVIDSLKSNDPLAFKAALKEYIGLEFPSFIAFNYQLQALSFLHSQYLLMHSIREEKAPVMEDFLKFYREESSLVSYRLAAEVLGNLSSALGEENTAPEDTYNIAEIFREKPLPYLQSLKHLSDTVENIPFKDVPNTCFNGHQVLNGDLQWVSLKKKPEDKEALFTLRMLSKDNGLAKGYLDYLIGVYQEELSKGVRICSKSPLLMEIARFDRRLNGPDYKAQLTKDLYAKWCQERKAYARDHEGQPEKLQKLTQKTILSERAATVSFEQHPEQYDKVKELRLHRAISTFDHELTLDDDNNLLIPTPKGPKPITQFMSLRRLGDTLVDFRTGDQYTYGQKGLQIAQKDPWESIEPFKHKERKTKDWRLEIATDMGPDEEGKEEVHSYVYLKTPNTIYSIGKFWDPDIDFPDLDLSGIFSLLSTYPAKIRSGDLHDFMAKKKTNHDPHANIKVTKIDLGSEENFNKALQFIQEYQTSFQLVGSNCSSLPIDLAAHFSIHPNGKIIAASYPIPFSLDRRKFQVRHSWIQTFLTLLLTPFNPLINTLMIALGALKIHPLTPNPRSLFSHPGKFFDPRATLIDIPVQLRAWQEVYEERHGNQVHTLAAMQTNQ